MNFWSRSCESFIERVLMLRCKVLLSSDLKLLRISLFNVELFVSIIDWNLSVCVSKVDISLA